MGDLVGDMARASFRMSRRTNKASNFGCDNHSAKEIARRAPSAQLQNSAKNRQTATRISVTIPPDHDKRVSRMAQVKKVSNAWIIHDAVEKYIESDTPLPAIKESRWNPIKS